MNNSPNSTTGFRPIDIFLGPCNHNFTPFVDEDEGTTKEGVEIPDYIKEFSTVKDQMLKRSAEYYDKLYQKKDKTGPETATTYQVGDLVLSTTERNAKTRNKLSPLLFGPYKVTKVDHVSNKYELQSLVDENTHEIHLSSLRPFTTEHVDPEAIAGTDSHEAKVISFLSHHGEKDDNDKFLKKSMHFLLLFDDGDAQWTPIAEAKKNDLYMPYINNLPDLHHLRTLAQAKDATTANATREVYAKPYTQRTARSERLRQDFSTNKQENPNATELTLARQLEI